MALPREENPASWLEAGNSSFFVDPCYEFCAPQFADLSTEAQEAGAHNPR
jgi:hypothetical protein